jgi:hypothetical protein
MNGEDVGKAKKEWIDFRDYRTLSMLSPRDYEEMVRGYVAMRK